MTSRDLALPIGPRWAYLRLPVPMSEKEWVRMEAILRAMKPGLLGRWHGYRGPVVRLPDAD